MADALQQVKTALGMDAVILHTRSFYRRRWLGLRRQNLVEITAGSGVNIGSRRSRSSSATETRHAARSAGGSGAGTRSASSGIAHYQRQQYASRAAVGAATGILSASPSGITERMGAAAAGITPQTAAGRELLGTPAATNIMIRELVNEITTLKSLTKEIVDTSRRQKLPALHEDLISHYQHLVDNQVADDIATEILRCVQNELRPELLTSSHVVREKITQQFDRLLPVSGPIVRTKETGPHVVALIGPTGVGKTTTLAKLAANLKLREQRQVGLITIDTYRIGAIDQLHRYADILSVPLRVVNSPRDLRDAVAGMDSHDYILIDTAGRSPNDAMKINELRHFIAAAQADEVHLVLSSTVSETCVDLAVRNFSEVGIDKVIFTKIDEAANLGAVVNVIRRINKGLSYITTGQDVPDDIEVGRGCRLAQLILGGGS